MNLASNIEMAVSSIRSNKMRSSLTMLGIIIGVAAVIVMISLGQGASRRIASQLSSMGTNLLMVYPGATFGTVRGAGGNVNTLTYEDALAISALPMVVHAAPEVGTNATAGYASQTWTAQVTGTTPEFQFIRDWSLKEGSFFTEDEVKTSAPVAVLGSTVAENLFPPGTGAVGQSIRINKLGFTVVGVLAPKGASFGGQDQDNVIIIPVTTAQKRLLGVNYVRSITVQVESVKSMNYVQSSIENLLRERHRLSAGAENDFNIRNMASVLEAAENTAAVMTALLASVAAVSLLVGGIGIMNIMLVSVTERTKEIGLRMAVGATQADILNQFLVESTVLCLTGGLIGIVTGIAGSKLLSALAGWPVYITAYPVLLAVGFSAATGIFFGYYPAKKAARLNPIDALRYE